MSTATSKMSASKEEEEVVYFHSGSGPSYRKVKVNGAGSGSFTSIPTIDISNINSPDASVRKALARDVCTACSETGFFYASNHGVLIEDQKDIFETMKNFFNLPIETKMDAHAHKNAAMRGYEPMLETQLDPRTKGGMSPSTSSSHEQCVH